MKKEHQVDFIDVRLINGQDTFYRKCVAINNRKQMLLLAMDLKNMGVTFEYVVEEADFSEYF